MSMIIPQSAANEQTSSLIVIPTVHGDAISVSMALLCQAESDPQTGKAPNSKAALKSNAGKEAA